MFRRSSSFALLLNRAVRLLAYRPQNTVARAIGPTANCARFNGSAINPGRRRLDISFTFNGLTHVDGFNLR
jgi:hypothetical protein